MTGQFDLGAKHLECINKTQNLISEIEAFCSENNKTAKEQLKEYLAKTFGDTPAESDIYNDYLGMVLSLEELAKQNSLKAYILGDQIIFREILNAYGNIKADAVLEKGQTVDLLCLEPGYSSHENLQTKAVKTAEGWQINGVKLISNEQLYCDKFLIFAKDEENNLRLFLIPEEKIKIKEIEKFISSSKIILNQAEISCKLDDSTHIAVVNDNFEKILTIARTIIAAISVGIGHSALAKSIETVKETKNSKGESLSSSQSVQFNIADMFSEIEAARMLTYYSADSIDKNKPSIKIASMAKVKASESATKIAMETLQILGNIGYIANTDFSSIIQRAVDGQIKGGTNRNQKALIYEYMLAKK